jgi:predicted RNA-binding Zn-ribbon protein involved in translation (DUF1610 family)
MSRRWECDACGAMVLPTQKGNHVHWKCPMQGEGRKKREAEERRAAGVDLPPEPKFFQYLACVCRCGTQIGQVKGQKKRQFVNSEHYEKWRKDTLRAAGGDGQTVEQRKHAEEVAAVVAKETAIQRAAAVVPMVTGDASFRLWARCLGLNVDKTAEAA